MTTENILLKEKNKNHTVENAVTNLKELPLNAKSVHLQPIRNMSVTIQVLEESTERVIETITGKATGGSISMNSTSLIRRTGSLTLSVEPDLFPQKGSLMWFGNIVRVYVGIKDMSQANSTVNFLVGTFWIDSGDYSIDENGSSISITLSDKMTKYDEEELMNPMIIPVDTPIDQAMRLVMENVGETSFGEFSDFQGMVVPYNLEYGIGEQVQKVITDIRDMYMDCYCGFNVMGQFEFKQLKVQKADEVSEPKWRFDSTDNDRADLTLSFRESYGLKSVRNHIIVYGGTSEKTGITPIGEVRITDVNSPFNIDAIGDRRKVIIEDKYVTDEQCIAQGRFEAWKSSNFQEQASITSVPIYILDANDIIEITHPETGVVSRYMVDTFSLGLDVAATMSIDAHKLYYIGLEYGTESLQIVEDFIRGIRNWGWLSLAEERIMACYNMVGSGKAQVVVRFVEGELGGEQASVTSYATTKTQTMRIDITDFAGLVTGDENGDNGRSVGDYADRVLGHEMFHAVMNDYLGHDVAVNLPVWFKEGFAEFLHGAKERFTYSYSDKTQAEKKASLIELAGKVLNNEWVGTSEEYVASYLVAIAIYRLCTPAQWENLFVNLRGQSNLAINFLAKLLPIAETNAEVAAAIIAEMQSMTDVWSFLFDANAQDTGSVGGLMFMNLYGVELDAESVFNNANATTDSIGFMLNIEK